MWIICKHICNQLILLGISKCPEFTQDLDIHSFTPNARLRSFLCSFFNLYLVQKETGSHKSQDLLKVTQLLKKKHSRLWPQISEVSRFTWTGTWINRDKPYNGSDNSSTHLYCVCLAYCQVPYTHYHIYASQLEKVPDFPDKASILRPREVRWFAKIIDQ